MLPIKKNNNSTLTVSTIKKATRAQLHLVAMIELDKQFIWKELLKKQTHSQKRNSIASQS